MRKKTLWLLGISLLFLILVTVLGTVWEDAAQQVDFARKNLPPGTGRAVWNRLDGAGYAETDGCWAFFKHPAGASDRRRSAPRWHWRLHCWRRLAGD